MNVNDIIEDYRQFLISSYRHLQKISTQLPNPEELISDFMQTNWETLVEIPIQNHLAREVYLEVYGDGAECNEDSSRVFKPEALPTHEVRCRPKEGTFFIERLSGTKLEICSKEGVQFEKFVCVENNKYRTDIPFDVVLLDCGDLELVSIDQVEFFLREIHVL